MADRRGTDDRGDGSGFGKPLKSSDRPASSTRTSDRSPDDRRRHRSPHPHSSSHNRHRSRDRHHNNGSSRSAETPTRSSQVPDLIPRFRDKQAKESESRHRSSHRSRSRDRDRHGDRHDSPSVSKRHRSRTPSPSSSHRKRSRRDGSTSRHERDRAPDSETRKRRESSSHRRSRSHKSGSRQDRPRSRSPSRRDRSPRDRDRDSERRSRRDSRDSRHRRRDKRSRSRSPHRGSTNDSHGRPHSNSEAHSASKEVPSHTRREGDDPTEAASRNSTLEGVDGATSGGRGGPDLKLPPKPPVDDRGRYSRSPQHRPQPGPASPPLQGFSRSNWSGQPRSPHHHSRSRYDRDTRPRSNGSSHTLSPTRQVEQHRHDSYRRGSRDGFRGPALAPRGSHREGDYFNGQRTSPSSEARPEQMEVDGQLQVTPRAEPPKNAPSGPASQNGPKFSFALKSTTKVPATPPKPEISQVFSLPPKREEPLPSPAPAGAPTQPASFGQTPRKPPDGPRMVPRMRKVKKVLKRLKPRPTLSTDMVESASVFYRKPGNESVVGSGTYGQVFKGLNVYTKGLAALKRIRMDNEKDGFPVTAIREIKLLQSLRHVNIVNLQEVMVEKNDCFMVFEYLSHDLTGLLNHPSFVLQPAQKKHLAKQLFEGMDYLHTRGVLHRDIKAANILVSKDGIIKIADFGLARFYAKRHQLDYTNRVITIWYRSPELLLGETKYTAAVDVWSTACVMMEIFTRNAIFPGDGSDLSQLDKIYNILGTPNRQDWPGLVDMAWFELMRPTVKRKSTFEEMYKDVLTPAAFDLMLSMFAYDPEKRPTSAQVLQHPYFTTEEPLPKQAIELADIGGDWHEFESKALRKERERKEREAARKAAAEKKRGAENGNEPEAKRAQIDAPAPPPPAA